MCTHLSTNILHHLLSADIAVLNLNPPVDMKSSFCWNAELEMCRVPQLVSTGPYQIAATHTSPATRKVSDLQFLLEQSTVCKVTVSTGRGSNFHFHRLFRCLFDISTWMSAWWQWEEHKADAWSAFDVLTQTSILWCFCRERPYLSPPMHRLITAQTIAASRTWWTVNILSVWLRSDSGHLEFELSCTAAQSLETVLIYLAMSVPVKPVYLSVCKYQWDSRTSSQTSGNCCNGLLHVNVYILKSHYIIYKHYKALKGLNTSLIQ